MTKPSENEEEKTAKRRVQVARDHDGRMGVAKGMYIYVYDKLKITHISRFLIKKFVLFVFLSTKLL